jgi:Fe-Mn family superoxide dismutase
MTSPNLKNNLKSIIDNTIRETISKTQESLNEAYVAQPKTFPQVSESLSDKTKAAHSELYKAYIESLNKISSELDSISKDSNNNYSQFRNAKIDETYNLNATWLHELYFANCFDPHSEIYMDSKTFMRFQRDWGSFEEWQKDFLSTGITSREGWVICGYNVFLKRFVNTVIDLHSTNVMVGIIPIICIDMWSHSYFKDYLKDKKSYLIAMMREINWNIVEDRVEKIVKIEEVLK